MALINVASSLDMAVRMWTPSTTPGTGPQSFFDVIGRRDPDSPDIHGWGITYGVDDLTFNQWVADNPDAAPHLKVVSQADIDFMSDPANTHGYEIGLQPPPVPIVPPVNIDVPYVAQSGATISSTVGNWDGEPTSYTYRWQLNYVDIANTTPSYTIQAADIGKTVCCYVTATNTAGSTEAPMSNPIVITNPAPITNTTVPQAQQQTTVVVCNTGSWTGSPTSYAYQWQVDGVNAGINNPSYTIVTPDDVGKTATCVVTASNAWSSRAAPPTAGVVITDPGG